MLNDRSGNPNHGITVWAPSATTVHCKMENSEIPMSRQNSGWWSLQTEQDLHNCEYSFVVDNKNPVPDPRSPSQPFGVHGVSKFVDHRRFQWTDGRWAVPLLRSGVIYELHIGTFTPEGTFDSAIERLDHLCRLGVTHVELMPRR